MWLKSSHSADGYFLKLRDTVVVVVVWQTKAEVKHKAPFGSSKRNLFSYKTLICLSVRTVNNNMCVRASFNFSLINANQVGKNCKISISRCPNMQIRLNPRHNLMICNFSMCGSHLQYSSSGHSIIIYVN